MDKLKNQIISLEKFKSRGVKLPLGTITILIVLGYFPEGATYTEIHQTLKEKLSDKHGEYEFMTQQHLNTVLAYNANPRHFTNGPPWITREKVTKEEGYNKPGPLPWRYKLSEFGAVVLLEFGEIFKPYFRKQ